jgi:hypothetical protein
MFWRKDLNTRGGAEEPGWHRSDGQVVAGQIMVRQMVFNQTPDCQIIVSRAADY